MGAEGLSVDSISWRMHTLDISGPRSSIGTGTERGESDQHPKNKKKETEVFH